MKYVRWLNAFRNEGVSRIEAATWEVQQLIRQVAVEPLWRGFSLMFHNQVGLVVDEGKSSFVKGYLRDAYTFKDEDTRHEGTILRSRDDSKGKAIITADRFQKEWNRKKPTHHGEVIFDHPWWSGVALGNNATPRDTEVAGEIARNLQLPIFIIPKRRETS